MKIIYIYMYYKFFWKILSHFLLKYCFCSILSLFSLPGPLIILMLNPHCVRMSFLDLFCIFILLSVIQTTYFLLTFLLLPYKYTVILICCVINLRYCGFQLFLFVDLYSSLKASVSSENSQFWHLVPLIFIFSLYE